MPPTDETTSLNLDAFERLDRVIHEKGRLAIMSVLAAGESYSFRELRELLGMTDGNLSVHMRTLEGCGFVQVSKRFVDRKPRTDYSLTERGRAAFAEYLALLDQIVQQSREAGRSRTAGVGSRLGRGMVPAK